MSSDLGVTSFSSSCWQGGAGQQDRRKTKMPSKFKKLVRERMAKTGEKRQSATRFVRAQVSEPRPETLVPADSRRFTGREAYYDESQTWFPLRRDGLWLEEVDWKRNLVGLRRRKTGSAALAALRAVFTPEWSQAQSGTKGLHPVVYDSITVGGRHQLLEVGAMLAMSDISKRLRERLLRDTEYYGACAELHVALLLNAAGAHFEAEPVKDGIGPDGVARWKNGSLAVEVKRPNESARARATQQVELEFFNEFSAAASDLASKVDKGVWLNLHVNANEWPTAVTGVPDLVRIRGLARDVAGIVRSRLTVPTTSTHFAVAPGVEVSISPGLTDEPRVQLGMHSHSVDAEHQAQRLFKIVQEAAKQLRAVPNLPGLVVLDADADFGILNYIGEIEVMLTEEWAHGLAAVAIVTKTTTSDDRLREARLDTVVRIVSSRMSQALIGTLLPGLRVCERGHYHVDPLLRPSQRCNAW